MLLLMFLLQDFYQKRQLAKMKALAADRAALPMAAYESTVVEAVRNNPAIVIAGDTGETQTVIGLL